MPERLKTAQKVTGVRQVTRALRNDKTACVYLAENADPRVREPIAHLARELSVPVIAVETMEALGSACGIAVGSAVAAILKG